MSDAARARIIALVGAVVPAADLAERFTCIARGDGAGAASLEETPGTRLFELGPGSPRDYGLTYSTVRLWVDDMDLRVRYEAPGMGDRERVIRVAQRDFRDIAKALQVPSAWQATMDTLVIGDGPPVREDVYGIDGPLAVILRYPLTIHYYE